MRLSTRFTKIGGLSERQINPGGAANTDSRMSLRLEALTFHARGAAIEVHRALGPELLESAYEECLCYELSHRKFAFERQLSLPVTYRNVRLDCGYKLDIVVEQRVVLKLKPVSDTIAVHEAQLLTYLKLG